MFGDFSAVTHCFPPRSDDLSLQSDTTEWDAGEYVEGVSEEGWRQGRRGDE